MVLREMLEIPAQQRCYSASCKLCLMTWGMERGAGDRAYPYRKRNSKPRFSQIDSLRVTEISLAGVSWYLSRATILNHLSMNHFERLFRLSSRTQKLYVSSKDFATLNKGDSPWRHDHKTHFNAPLWQSNPLHSHRRERERKAIANKR